MIPDIEKVLSGYLRADEDVTALDTRIRATTPGASTGGTDDPWVRVTMLDAQDSPQSRAEHLISYLVQLDIYAGKDGGQPEANLHARTIRAALHGMPGVHADAVVTSVRFNGHLRLPDGDFEPARERVILTATVHAHALPS